METGYFFYQCVRSYSNLILSFKWPGGSPQNRYSFMGEFLHNQDLTDWTVNRSDIIIYHFYCQAFFYLFWNSDIRIKDSYGATNGFAGSYADGSGGETCVFGVNGGTGDSKFLSRLVNWNIDQHNHFVGKKDSKVGLHKSNQFIRVEPS